MRRLALVIAAACIGVVMAFAVVWLYVLATLGLMWLAERMGLL